MGCTGVRSGTAAAAFGAGLAQIVALRQDVRENESEGRITRQ